jgi:hypothetical protein
MQTSCPRSPTEFREIGFTISNKRRPTFFKNPKARWKDRKLLFLNVLYFRFPGQQVWRWPFSDMLRHVVSWKLIDDSEVLTAAIIRAIYGGVIHLWKADQLRRELHYATFLRTAISISDLVFMQWRSLFHPIEINCHSRLCYVNFSFVSCKKIA